MRNELEKPAPEGEPTVAERLARIELRMALGFRAQQDRAGWHLCALLVLIGFQGFAWNSWWNGWSDTLTALADRVFTALHVHSLGLPTVYPGDLIALAVMGLILVYCLRGKRQLPGQQQASERLALRLGQALRRIIRTC